MLQKAHLLSPAMLLVHYGANLGDGVVWVMGSQNFFFLDVNPVH